MTEDARIWWILEHIKEFQEFDRLIRIQDFTKAAKLRDVLKKGLKRGNTRTDRKTNR